MGEQSAREPSCTGRSQNFVAALGTAGFLALALSLPIAGQVESPTPAIADAQISESVTVREATVYVRVRDKKKAIEGLSREAFQVHLGPQLSGRRGVS